MAQLIRFLTGGGGDQKIPPAQARLPQDSVVISDRTRHANKLGEGSFAKVYKGEYNGKPCAVKVFKEDVLKKEFSPDPGSEVEMLSKVQHTNVVQMYGMWYDPHKDRVAASIVMELCTESLYEFIRQYTRKIAPKEKKLRILRDTARGMVYLHGLNIIHGDLRSSNILLVHSEDETVTVAKLADFDMAKLLDPDTQRRLTTRFTDEDYLPPEVFDHKQAKDHKKKWALLTPKVDVFCFGEVVLEMGCGTYPKPASKYSGREMLTELKRRDKYVVKLKQSDKESLGAVVRKCLADAPDSRPDFTEILHDVEGYLHKYGARPDLENLQDKTAECELLRAQALKWEDDSKSLCSAQDRVDLLERELDITREEKQDLQVNLDISKTKVEELKKENHELSQRERDALEKSYTMSGQTVTLELQLRDAKEDLDGKNQLIGTRDAELKILNGQLIDSEVQMKKKEADWADLEKSYLKVMSEKDTLTRELVQVKAERDELDEHKKTMEEAKTAADMELDKTRKEREALREDVRVGHDSLACKTEEHAKAVKEVTTLNHALEQKAVIVGELQDKSHNQEDIIQQLNRDLLNMNQEVTKLKNEGGTLRQERADLQSSLNATEKNFGSTATERDHLQKKLQEKATTNARLLKCQKDKEEEIKTLKKQNATAENSSKGKETKLSQMDVQLKRERSEWTSERSVLEQELAKVKETAGAQLKTAESSLAATTAQLVQLVAAKDEMAATLQQLQEECDRLKHEHQKELAEKMEELEGMKREMEEKDGKLVEHKTLLAGKELALATQSQEVTKLQEELSRTVKEFESTMETQTKELEDITAHKKKCESERDSLRREKEAWVKTEANLKDDVVKLQETCSRMETSRIKLESQLQDAKSDLQAEKDKLLGVQQNSHQGAQELVQCKSELQAERDKLQRHEKTALQKEKELDQCKADLQAERDRLRHIERTAQQMEKELVQCKADHQAEIVKLHSVEETARQRETELNKCKGNLKAERDKVHTMEKTILQKDKDIEQGKNELAIAKAKKRNQENTVMKELKAKLDRSEDQKTSLLGEKEDQKKRENALQDTVKALEEQHSDVKGKLIMCEKERDSLKEEKADHLRKNQQMELDAQQLEDEMAKAVKAKDAHLQQYQEVEVKLLKLSGNHAKKMAELKRAKESLESQLKTARKEAEQCIQHEALTKAEEMTSEEQQEASQLKAELQTERDKLRSLEKTAHQRETELNKCKAALKAEIDKLHGVENTAHQRETELNKCKKQLEDDKRKCIDEMTKLSKEHSLRKQALDKKQKELSSVTEMKKSLDKEFSHLKEEKSELLDSKRLLASRLEELRTLNRTLMQEREQSSKQYSDLESQNAELKKKYEDIGNQLQQAQNQLEELALNRKENAHSLKEMKKRVEMAEQRLANQQTTIRRLMQELHERKVEKETLQVLTTITQEQVNKLKDDLERNSKELDDIQKSLVDKQAEYAKADKAKCQLEEEMQAKIEQLQLAQERLANLGESLQRVTVEKEEARAQADMAEERNVQLEKDLSCITAQLDVVTKKCELIEQAEDSMKSRLEAKSAEAEELRATSSELRASLASEESARKSLEEAAEHRQTELQRLYGAEEANQRTIKDLADMLQKTEVDKERYFQETGQLKDQLRQERELKSRLQEECERLRGDIVTHERTIEEQVAELAKCKENMDAMQQGIAELSAEKCSIEERLAKEKCLLLEKKKELAQHKEESTQFKFSLEQEVARLEEEVKQLKHSLKSQMDQFKEEGKRLNKRFESHKQQLMNQLEEKSKMKKDAEDSRDELESQVATMEQDFATEKGEHENTRHKLETAEAELTEAKLTLQDKEAIVQDKEAIIQDKDAKLADKVKECHLMEDAQIPLLTKTEELEGRLDKAQKEMESLKTELEKVKREGLVLKTDNTVLQKALEQKTASSMAMEEENRRLRDIEIYHKKFKRQKQSLKQGQAEVQRGLQAVKEEKVKLKWQHKSEEQVEKAVETLRVVSKQERDEMVQEQQRVTQQVLSTLATANQDHVDTVSRKLDCHMTLIQRQGSTQQQRFSTQVETTLHQIPEQVLADQQENLGTFLREIESKLAEMKYSFQQYDSKIDELRTHSSGEHQQAHLEQQTQMAHIQDELHQMSKQLIAAAVQHQDDGAFQKKMPVGMENTMTQTTPTSMQMLLTLHTLATFSPSSYLHSLSGQFVVEQKQLEQVCHTETISVSYGSPDLLRNALPSALGEFVHKISDPDTCYQLDATCLVIPYVTFSDRIRLCRMFVCHTPAGYDDKGTALQPETVVAIAEVVVKKSNSCGSQLKSMACAEGLVYSPTWHCGHSEELQACFTDCILLPELTPVLQQLEMATTREINQKFCEALSMK